MIEKTVSTTVFAAVISAITSAVGVTAFAFTTFETKQSVQTALERIEKRLDRLESGQEELIRLVLEDKRGSRKE